MRKILREHRQPDVPAESGKPDDKGVALMSISQELLALMRSEVDAMAAYQKAIDKYGSFGWGTIFGEIQADEKEHLEKLKLAFGAVQEHWYKTGEIKS